MKTKEIQCVNYICEHQCNLGKDATFYGLCQKCAKYEAKAGAKPNRTNTKKDKLNRLEKKYD